jgi:hypothetical protein
MRVSVGLFAVSLLFAGNANAADVTFVGTILSICTVIAAPGLMQVNEAGDLVTEGAPLGGAPALVTIASVGTHNVEVTPPEWLAVVAPGYTPGGETFSIAYDTTSGVEQGYTTSTTDFEVEDLTTVMTVNVNIASPNPFLTGVYTAVSEVTCGPP